MSTSIAWSILSSTASHGACCFFGFPLACASCHSLAREGDSGSGDGGNHKPGFAKPSMRLWTSPAHGTAQHGALPLQAPRGCRPRFFELSPRPTSVLPEAEAVEAVAVGGVCSVCLQHQRELGGRNTSQGDHPRASHFQRSCSCVNTAIVTEKHNDHPSRVQSRHRCGSGIEATQGGAQGRTPTPR